jgi:biopolymer transport protein ExbD
MTRSPDFEPPEARSDTTPMIDVVFLMIVFFVCIDFRVLEAKLPAYLPRDVGGSSIEQPVEQLQVCVRVAEQGERVYPPQFTRGDVDASTGRPARYRLVGHRTVWDIGPNTFPDPDSALRELRRIAQDPGSQVPDKTTGGRRLMSCMVNGMRGARYDDVARAVDACREAGFLHVDFGGGGGPL